MNKKQYLDLIDGIGETIKSIEDGLSVDYCEDEEGCDIDSWETYSDEGTIAYDIGYINGLRWVKSQLCDPLKAQETDSDPLKVSEETQSALNKIADSYLRANYPSSSSGLFAYAEINDIEGGYNEETDEEYDVYEVFIVYGIQEEGYKEEYCEKILVRTDNLEVVK